MTTVYVTVPRDAAAALARRLVDERLAACVNRVDCASVYRWEGAVHEDDEAILLAKTSADRYDALVDRVRELHPHEVPCVERFDEADVLSAFATWRDEAVAVDRDDSPASDPDDRDGPPASDPDDAG